MTRLSVFKLIIVTILLSDSEGCTAARGSAGGFQAGDQEREWYVRRVDEAGAVEGEWARESVVGTREQRARWMEIYEVSQHPGESRASDAQRRAADDLVGQSLASAEKHGWYDFEKARGDGFELMIGGINHYVNETFTTDDRFLDPDRPEVLLYYDTPKGKRLAGFMYLTRSSDERGLQIGGPLTVWHYHVYLWPPCWLRGVMIVGVLGEDGRCARGISVDRSGEMMHVWLVDHPDGSFATGMVLPPETIEALAERPD
jgi:hypothetical protein